MPISRRRRSSWTSVPQGDLLALWRWLRRRGGAVGWRAAVDALRPHSQALWQALPAEQQRRFLRHARPWWDVHRHRIAPQVARQIAELVAAGRLEIVAGRIAAMRGDGMMGSRSTSGGAAAPALRTAARSQSRALPLRSIAPGRWARSRGRAMPLLRGLLERGVVRADAHRHRARRRRALAGRRRAAVGAGAADQRAVLGDRRGARHQGAGGGGRRRHCASDERFSHKPLKRLEKS